jgi:glucose-6-phosphate isomerase
MFYGIIAIIIAAFGGGYYTASSFDKAELFALKNAIERANEQGRSAMTEATRMVNEAQKQAIEANNELDKANEASINTINAYYDRVRQIKPRSDCPVSKTNNTTEPSKDAGNTYNLLAELHRADLAAIDKNTLLKFVRTNCGIK